MKNRDEVCGTCKWNMAYYSKGKEDFICGNPDNEYFDDYTPYTHSCGEWVEKE